MRARVLITGIAGFIGSNLADRLLREGFRVIGIDNLSYGVKEQIPHGVEFYQLDVRSKEIYPVFQNVEFIFHLAAKNSINDCQLDPVETSDINVTGTVNVLEAARRAGVKKVIYAESSAMYEGSDTFPTPEAEIKPQTFYAVSKFSSMIFAQGFARFFGLSATALRYFCVYGPRQDYRRTIPPVFSAFIMKLLKGEAPIIYGTGEKRRDFVHIDDVNDFHLLCMTDERTTGKVFNVGSGVNHSVNEMYHRIADLVGARIRPVYRSDLPGEATQTLADITEARKLGWVPRVSLDDGLRSSINYIKSELQKGNV